MFPIDDQTEQSACKRIAVNAANKEIRILTKDLLIVQIVGSKWDAIMMINCGKDALHEQEDNKEGLAFGRFGLNLI